MTTSPTASQSQVSTSSATHSMPNTDVRHMSTATYDAARVSSSPCYDVIYVGGYHIANVYKPPTGTRQICHLFFLILQSCLVTLTAIIQTGDIRISGG